MNPRPPAGQLAGEFRPQVRDEEELNRRDAEDAKEERGEEEISACRMNRLYGWDDGLHCTSPPAHACDGVLSTVGLFV